MDKVIEYVIVGGPQHGLIRPLHSPTVDAGALVIASRDGELCRVAARRRSRADAIRMLLLHPQATGEQFRSMLAA